MKNTRLWLPTPIYEPMPWRIRFEKVRGCWGDCDREQRIIRIDPSQSSEMLAATAIHEINHAIRPDDETIAEATEAASMAILELLGVDFDGK